MLFFNLLSNNFCASIIAIGKIDIPKVYIHCVPFNGTKLNMLANVGTITTITCRGVHSKNETIKYTEDPIVSSDTIGITCGALVDGLLTNIIEVDGKQLDKVVAWYDNEMSYSSQMVRTAKYFANK